MTNVRRNAALLAAIVFGVLSIGGDGCLWDSWGNPPPSPMDLVNTLPCPSPSTYWTCARSLQNTQYPALEHCTQYVVVCVPPQLPVNDHNAQSVDAERLGTEKFAQKVPTYPWTPVPGIMLSAPQANVNCDLGVKAGVVPNGEVQDEPLCSAEIDESDGGAPSGPCIAGTDPCSSCLNGFCCDDYDACVTALGVSVCDRVVGYWLGTGPGPEGVSSTAIDNLNSCASMNCGDPSACTAYRRPPPDGGL